MVKQKKSRKETKNSRKFKVTSKRPVKSAKKIPLRKHSISAQPSTKKSVILSEISHLRIDKPKVIAPSSHEKNLALKTLSMIYQNSELSGDESKVFRNFLERFKQEDMEKADLYEFLRSNPGIRRKFWDAELFE